MEEREEERTRREGLRVRRKRRRLASVKERRKKERNQGKMEGRGKERVCWRRWRLGTKERV